MRFDICHDWKVPPMPLGGDYVPMKFYDSLRTSDSSKEELQNKLRNFLENLQKNLTTSTLLSGLDTSISSTQNHFLKLQELSTFFHDASETAGSFARDSETFYEVTKNSSYALLLKLRQVPMAQPTEIKILLTNYFAEMEFFHIMFSEIMDEALEYTQYVLRAIQKVFIYYADAQRYILQDWNLKPNMVCCKMYMDFLQLYSAQIFKCAADHELNIAYDVYAMAETNAKYIMRQLEFRIQRLFNCFLFKSYQIRCQFLLNAEQDFEKLFSKLEELETYFDIKTKRGRVSALRLRRNLQNENDIMESRVEIADCLPKDFPHGQMQKDLKSCFYFVDKRQPISV
ncbi:uncharacterized protein [Drosophila tropicalis]|uniref:uncharacterized protein n=1 Tax=Drosophila tropicalis TaxID=46794 RepID=UPI0035ABBD6A